MRRRARQAFSILFICVLFLAAAVWHRMTGLRQPAEPKLTSQQIAWLTTLGSASNSSERQRLLLSVSSSTLKLLAKRGPDSLATDHPPQAQEWLPACKGLMIVAGQTQDSQLRAQAAYRYGWLLTSGGRWSEAADYFQAAAPLFNVKENPLGVAMCYYSIGSCYRTLGHYADALRMYDKAKPLFEQTGDRQNVALCYSNYGYVLRMLGHNMEALPMYARALEIFEVLKDQEAEGETAHKKELADCYADQGNTYREVGDVKEAFNSFDKAQKYSTDNSSRARCQVGRGNILQKQGDIDAALQQYESALKLSSATPDDHNITAVCEFNCANIYRERGECGKALACYEHAIKILRSINNTHSIADCEFGQANTLRTLGRVQEAAKVYEQTFETVQTLRSGLTDAELAASAWSDFDQLPAAIASVTIKAGHAEKAFDYVQRSKGMVLRQNLLTHRGGAVTGTREQSDTTKLLTSYEQKEHALIDEQAGSAHISAEDIQDKDQARREYSSLDAKRRVYGSQGSSRLLSPASLQQIGKALGPTTAALEIVVDKDAICFFLVKQINGKTAIKICVKKMSRSELASRTEKYLLELTKPYTRRDAKTLHQNAQSLKKLSIPLYEALIGPIAEQLKDIRTLVICPDQFLHHLPFASLQNAQGKCLIENFEVIYAPSVSAWEACCRKSQERQGQQNRAALFVGKSHFKGRRQIVTANFRGAETDANPLELPELHAVGHEQGVVIRSFPGSTALTEENATVPAVRTALQHAGLIHIATHGYSNAEAPLLSALYLSPAQKDDIGLLFAHDVYDMQLRASLVVLSACDTSAGPLTANEGSLGLAWTFLIAGCPSVIASEGTVYDQAGLQWITAFYDDYPKGGTISAHFRQACCALIRSHDSTEDYSSPHYWANWTLLGAGK